jgi:general L-amino acid transport system substrate-binding protein
MKDPLPGPNRAQQVSTAEMLFALNFRSGLLIGLAVAIAVAAAAIAYERYDTQTLKRTVRRDAVLCGAVSYY